MDSRATKISRLSKRRVSAVGRSPLGTAPQLSAKLEASLGLPAENPPTALLLASSLSVVGDKSQRDVSHRCVFLEGAGEGKG